MGTRSDIIVQMTDGKFARIYCHWDGYLDHNGRILQGHYASQEKAEALIALGDLSVLRENIGVKHPFNEPSRYVGMGTEKNPAYEKHNKKFGKMCLAYGRDRGETETEAHFFDSLSEAWPPEDTWTEFVYVWQGGKWYAGDSDKGSQTLVPLADALAGNAAVTPDVKVPFIGAIGKHKPLSKSH